MSVQAKNILITGATGGIGQAIVAELARRGARLHAVGRNRGLLDGLDAQYGIGAGGGTVIQADISEPAGRQAVLAACERLPLDMLINCAGVNDFGLYAEQDEATIEHMIAVNVTGTLLLTRKLLGRLLQARQGRIVNIGSTFGSIGHPGFVAYCATKFALRGFSEALRRELAGSGLRVDYIAPRATLTALNGDPVREMNRALDVRMDRPEQVAAEVLRVIGKNRAVTHFIGWPEKLFVRINSIFPGLVDASLFKRLATIAYFASHKS